MLARHGCGIRNPKGPAHVQAALARSQTRLALSYPKAHQRARSEGKMPTWATLAQRSDRFRSQQTCLVEAAIGVFRPMERDRNNKHLVGHIARKLHDCTRQHFAEFRRYRAQAVVLQCMNQIPQFPRVRSIRNRPLEGWRSKATSAAESGHLHIRVFRELPRKNVERVAATLTHGIALDRNFRPAGVTNWRGGELRQGGSAEGAARREDYANYRIDGTSEHAGYCAPSGNLGWRNVERQ